MICSITRFRNRISGCWYSDTRTRGGGYTLKQEMLLQITDLAFALSVWNATKILSLGIILRVILFIHSFIHFNSGSKAHKTTDKSSDIKAYTNIKTQKDRQRIHRENCTEEC